MRVVPFSKFCLPSHFKHLTQQITATHCGRLQCSVPVGEIDIVRVTPNFACFTLVLNNASTITVIPGAAADGDTVPNFVAKLEHGIRKAKNPFSLIYMDLSFC